jgi:hypothetical protein
MSETNGQPTQYPDPLDPSKMLDYKILGYTSFDVSG